MKQKLICALALAAAGMAMPSLAAPLVVYSNNFDSPAVLAGGIAANFNVAGGANQSTVGAYNATYGQIFRNNSTGMTQLQLSNLPSHNSADVSFLMAFLDSWDSRNGTPAPDNLDLWIDGVLLHSYTYNNASGSTQDIGGGALVAQGVQFDSNQFFSDTIVDMASDPALAFAHSASTLTFGWQASGSGWQGGSDEAWGIDNLNVTLNTVTTPGNVPEPGILGLLGLGLAGIAFARRRIA